MLRIQTRGHDELRYDPLLAVVTPRPLSDLVHCGVCGGKMALINQSRYRCVARRNNIDNCTNGRGIAAAELETRAAQKLHDWVISQPNWAAELGQAAQSLSQRRAAIETRIAGHGPAHRTAARRHRGGRTGAKDAAAHHHTRADAPRAQARPRRHRPPAPAPAQGARAPARGPRRRACHDR